MEDKDYFDMNFVFALNATNISYAQKKKIADMYNSMKTENDSPQPQSEATIGKDSKEKITFHIDHNPDDWEVEVKDGCYTLTRKKPTTVDDVKDESWTEKTMREFEKNFYETGKKLNDELWDKYFKYLKENHPTVEASKHEEEKKLMLVTEDGVEIFYGDKYVAVQKATFDFIDKCVRPLTLTYDWVTFSTEEKAKEYIAQNKKTISYKELTDFLNNHYNGTSYIDRSYIIEHFKPKS